MGSELPIFVFIVSLLFWSLHESPFYDSPQKELLFPLILKQESLNLGLHLLNSYGTDRQL